MNLEDELTAIDRTGWRAPIVAARAIGVSKCGVWRIEIDCPYCPATHQHGGGSGETPDLTGHRVQHCKDMLYRQRKTFDASATLHMPGYALAPADADVDWGAERALADSMIEAVEMAIDEATQRDAWKRTAVGRMVNEQIEKLGTLAGDKPKRKSRSQSNAEYLAAWKAKRAWMEAS